MNSILKISSGVNSGEEYSLHEGEYYLGRSTDVDLSIKDPAISRKHALISIKDGKASIKDLNSNNGLFVNSEKISEVVLNNNDVIKMGQTEMIYEEVSGSENSPNDLKYTEDEFSLEKSVFIDATLFKPQAIDTNCSDAELARSNKQLRAMLKISEILSNPLDINELCKEIMDVVLGETGATRGFMVICEDDQYIPLAVKKKGSKDETLNVSKTLLKSVIDSRQAVLSSDLMQDDRFNDGVSIIANQIRSCMCAPLIFNDEVLGAIHVDSDISSGVFTKDDLEMLVAVATQSAMSVKNSSLLKSITEEQNRRSRLSQYFPPAQVELLLNTDEDIELGGKKENVSILFCDIRKFTAISESLDAMSVMNFLNDFFSIMTDVLFKYDGMVDNFIGDCIMAVFGGPFISKDHPLRAVKAALEMQEAQNILNERFISENRQSFDIGIGVHSGDVSRGNIGSPQQKKYTVIGSNVNVCARLCSIAQKGEVLVSESTSRYLGDRIFCLEERDPVKVKNVTKPLKHFCVSYNQDTN